MSSETSVHLRLASASVFEAVQERFGQWRLGEHRFDPQSDEVRISYDVGGTGRVAITVGFEFDAAQMAALLQRADPAD